MINKIYFIIINISIILFLSHKIESRFIDTNLTLCEPKWQCKFPGLIVSHKPFGNIKIGLLIILIYILITSYISLNIYKILNNIQLKKNKKINIYILLLLVFLWILWTIFETHHKNNISQKYFLFYNICIFIPGTIVYLLYL